MTICQNRVKELFDYKEDGNLIWIKISRYNRVQEGSIAGTPLGRGGYKRVSVDGKNYLLHRLVFLWHYGYMPENEVDHIDKDSTNNRIENLREVSRSCNIRNSNERVDNTSGIKGVTWHKRLNRWGVRIFNKKEIHLGYFEDFTEAAAHRLAAEQALNWSSCNFKTSASIYIDNYINGIS